MMGGLNRSPGPGLGLFARIALFLPAAALLTWGVLTVFIALSYWLNSPAFPELQCLVHKSSSQTAPCGFKQYMDMVSDVVFMTSFMSGGIFFFGPFAIIFCLLIFLQGKFGKADESLDRKFREHQERRQRPPIER